MKNNSEKNEDRAAEIIRRAYQIRQNRLAQIEKLRNGMSPKLLEGRTRLNAALFVRSRYEELLKPKGSFTLNEITVHIQESSGVPKGMRIHRWMLKANETAITSELEKAYQNSSMPQKKTRVYLNLVAALAQLSGQNPEDAMIAFLDETGLSDRISHRNIGNTNIEYDPKIKFAELIRDFVAHVAHEYDLANIFERAEQLQVGWNPDEGPSAVFLNDAYQRFTPSSVTSGQWLTDALPPLPCVALANIPFGHLSDADFILTPSISEQSNGPEFDQNIHRKMTGTATAYWVLYLAIAPQPSGGVQPLFIRTTKLSVSVMDPQDENASLEVFNIFPHKEALGELHIDNNRPVSIDWNKSYHITFGRETSELLMEHEENFRYYRNPRRKNDTDEFPPYDDIPDARITRVSPLSVQDWLLDDLSFMDAQIELQPILAAFEDNLDNTPSTWFVGNSLAQSIELAIRNGLFDSEFKKWIETFKASLSGLERQHLVKMRAEDEKLKTFWREETKNHNLKDI